MDGGMHAGYLVHHLFVHRQSSGRIDDHRIESVLAGIGNGVLGNLHRVFVPVLGVHLHADPFGQYFQLVDGRRTVHVAGYQEHLAVFFGLQVQGQFSGKSRLTGTLETGDQDHGRFAFQIDLDSPAAHQLGELVLDDLDEHLPRIQGGMHPLADGAFLDPIGKFLGYLVVDVGIDQHPADFLGRLGDLDFTDAMVALDHLQGAFQFFA